MKQMHWHEKVKQLQKVKVLPLLVSSPPSEKLRLLSISTPSSSSDLSVGQDRWLNFVLVSKSVLIHLYASLLALQTIYKSKDNLAR